MNRSTRMVRAARALALSLGLVSVTAAPLSSFAQTPPTVDAAAVAQLSKALATAATSADAAGRTKGQSGTELQVAIEGELERAIALSGSDPNVALAALQTAQASMQAAGTLTPPIAAAFAAVSAKIRAALKDAPAAIGGPGTSALSAPTNSGGGGGSDYRTAG